jgi:Uma2 family endonuclease
MLPRLRTGHFEGSEDRCPGTSWHAADMVTLVDRPFDLKDLFAAPDDGNRYEVLDGALVVTPPPGPAHQTVVGELFVVLREAARSRGLRVFMAPLAWRIGPGQVPEPDLMVVSPEAVGGRAIEKPPVIVVEVLSPTGKDRDLFDKRRIYAQAGAEWYWLVDPAGPSLTVLRLVEGRYEEAARVVGDFGFTAEDPFPVTVVPDQLLG